jgi:hypothetical protein
VGVRNARGSSGGCIDRGSRGDLAMGAPTRLRLLVGLMVGLMGVSCSSSKSDRTAECQTLQDRFFAALPTAQSCSATGGGQCQQTVPLLDIGCASPICMVAVNDGSALMPIETQWNLLGCSQLPGYACAQGCRVARTGICASQDGGAICDP